MGCQDVVSLRNEAIEDHTGSHVDENVLLGLVEPKGEETVFCDVADQQLCFQFKPVQLLLATQYEAYLALVRAVLKCILAQFFPQTKGLLPIFTEQLVLAGQGLDEFKFDAGSLAQGQVHILGVGIEVVQVDIGVNDFL